jgi:hypothetical protein
MQYKIITAFFLFLYASNLYAVRFHSYINEKGETVFSNVPEKCIQKSALTCSEYHPVMSNAYKNPVKQKIDNSQTSKRSKPRTNKRAYKSDNKETFLNTSVGSSFEILNNIVEMNNLMNEYYPAEPNKADADRVRQQQEDILDVLQIIKGASSEGEKSSIEKAINILRENVID